MTIEAQIKVFNKEGAVIFQHGYPMVAAYVGIKKDKSDKEHLWFYSGGENIHFGPPLLALIQRPFGGKIFLEDKDGNTIWEMIHPEFAFDSKGEAVSKVEALRGYLTEDRCKGQAKDNEPAENGSFAGQAPGWDK